MSQPKTLFEKIWDGHLVVHEAGSPAVLYIDLHLVHEVTSPQAFQGLRDQGLTVRRPDLTQATLDQRGVVPGAARHKRSVCTDWRMLIQRLRVHRVLFLVRSGKVVLAVTGICGGIQNEEIGVCT